MRQLPSAQMQCSARVIHFTAQNDVSIELFTVPFEELDKSIHNLVGVREFSDVSSSVGRVVDIDFQHGFDMECQPLETMGQPLEIIDDELNGGNQQCNCSLFERCPGGAAVLLI